MAEPLKYMYNSTFFDRLCPILKERIPDFDEKRFIRKVFDTQWPNLELKQRTRQVTRALHEFMPADFVEACKIIVAISNQLRQNKEREQSYPLIFLPDYIELYGLSDFEISMNALQEITKLVSAEFAIRPFLLMYPQRTIDRMKLWSKDHDAFVRRLSTEGCRPRLPWAVGLPAFKKDPSAILPILENLNQDPSEYVRRSVANNLNDIAKDHPSLVLETVKKWGKNNPFTNWIIKHGCRTLLKKGVGDVLRFHGFNPQSKNEVKGLKTSSKTIKIGEYLNFDFVFRNLEKKQTRYRLEYAIDYVTSTGRTSRKIFKIGEYIVKPNARVRTTKRQSFKDFTTRKHFRGKHTLSILVNGNVKAFVAFAIA
jgi:3-methyladenine DNA glycosylase AlkC